MAFSTSARILSARCRSSVSVVTTTPPGRSPPRCAYAATPGRGGPRLPDGRGAAAPTRPPLRQRASRTAARASRRNQLRRAKLVAHRDERVDRVVPHRRLRLMVAEPSPFEEIGERADGVSTRVKGEQGALDVLERRLGG